jgi:hypothetical protein
MLYVLPPWAVADAVQEEILFRAYEKFDKSPPAQEMSWQERERAKARIAELQSLYTQCQVVCARWQAEPEPQTQ